LFLAGPAEIQPRPRTTSASAACGPLRPNLDAIRPDLASSLNNLSASLADLGRREGALAAIAEAAQVNRELAARWPDAYYQLEQSL